jgi:multicomponent Na+:H+ antiporter subunit D
VVVGVPLVADGLATGFIGLTSVLVAGALAYLSVSHERRPTTLLLTLLLLGAFNGFVLAGDLLTMFVFLELFGVVVYGLTAGKVEDPAAMPATINLAVVSTTGAVLFLAGAGLLYRLGGTPNLAQLGERLSETEVGPAVAVAIVLLLGGLAIKAGLAPFHFAHVDLHTANWSPHAGLFGAVMLPLGLYGILRLHTVALTELPGVEELVRPVLLVASVLTALVGAVMSVMQDQLKRLLAFSSVAHLGVAGVGLSLLDATGVAASGAYVIGHGLIKVALLLVAGVLLHRLGTLHLSGLVGQGRRAPAATALLAAGAPLLAGLPPSGMFVGKAGMGEALEGAGLAAVKPVIYLTAALTGAAVARAVAHLWSGWEVPHDDIGYVLEHRPDELDTTTPRTLLAVPGVLLVAGLLVPLVPGGVEGVAQAGANFTDPAAYRSAVLATAETPKAPEPAELDPWKADAAIEGAGAAMLGVVLGVLVARWWRRGHGLGTAPLRSLRRLHTGLINDQITWLTVALAAWCAVALVQLAG